MSTAHMVADPIFSFRNHYVPEHYLKRWSGGTPRVWTYRLLVPHEHVQLWKNYSLESIGRRNHLYTRIREGNESDELERWFSTNFECPANLIIEKVVTGEPLVPDDWRTLARFVALQDVRTPARMTEIIESARDYLPAMLKEVLEGAVEDIRAAKDKDLPLPVIQDKPRAIPLPMAVRTEIEPGAETGTLRIETVAGRGYWLYAVEVLLTQTVKLLESHRWTVVRPPVGMKWLTSDNPVVKLNFYSNGSFDLGGGWGNPGSEILLPLSPEYLLYTQVGKRPRFARGDRLPEPLASQIQGLIIKNAHRYIFSDQIDPAVPNARPRVVSKEMVRMEDLGWAEFHGAQTKAEQELHD
ncbi:MAG TPA: DUF4238 domain-containing protein [Thiobacillus sp.]|nr:MAG: hypothetical protein B7Y21_00355 [Hydrogenophilales bacterium 16-61-112]HQT70572.1 DUF4238 domain-containing protein [Thiobacillus sp.]